MNGSPATNRRLFAVLAALGLCWAFFVHFSPHYFAANEAVRLYFVQAVAQDGTPQLDAVARRHGSVPVDRSEYGGHLYMDKAPGLSLLVLPLYPLVRALHPLVETQDLWLFGYLACLAGVTLPLLLSLWLLGRWLTPLVGEGESVWILLALGLASPLWVYATVFFGHGLAAAGIAAGFFALAAQEPGAGSVPRRLLAGLALGYAGLTDTPVFVLDALVCLWTLLRAAPPSSGLALRQRILHAAPVVLGVASCVAVQLAYNTWTLGHPLRFAYQFKGDPRFAAIMRTGFLGFAPPSLDALYGLWLGARRGLLYHAPWLALGLCGHALAALRRDLPWQRRLDAGFLLAAILLYAWLVAGFADWPAGDSAFARHLLPIVPLLAAGLAHLPPKPWLRAVLLASVLYGMLLALPVVATFPYHFEQLTYPVWQLSWPLLTQGRLAPSLGRLLGLPDAATLALFGALLLLPWLLWARLPQLQPKLGWRPLAGALALLTLALALAVGDVPPPDRTVVQLRAQAIRLLQP